MRKGLTLVGPVKPQEPPSSVSTAIKQALRAKAENTRRIYLGIASHWSEFLGAPFESPSADRLWTNATHSNAQAFMLELSERPAQPTKTGRKHKTVSDATLRHKATILYAIYDELIAQGLCEVNPFVRVRKDYEGAKLGQRRPHVRIESDQVKQLLKRPKLDHYGDSPKEVWLKKESVRDHVLLLLLFMAGLRRSEVCKLTLGDVQKTTSGTMYLILRDTKAGGDQEIALPDGIVSDVDELLTQRRSEGAKDESPLIVCYYSKGIADHHPMSDSTLYRLFKELCERKGLGHVTPHCARATFVTRLLDQGLSHRDVAVASRHSSVQMVERYDKRRVSLEENPSKKISY